MINSVISHCKLVIDCVRVSTSALNSEVRKLNKANLQKLVVIKFSAKIYKVHKVVKSRMKAEFSLDSYILEDKNGVVQLEEFNLNKPNKVLKPKKFKLTDLLQIDPATIGTRSKKIIEQRINNIVAIQNQPVETRQSTRVRKPVNKLNL